MLEKKKKKECILKGQDAAELEASSVQEILWTWDILWWDTCVACSALEWYWQNGDIASDFQHDISGSQERLLLKAL